MTTTIKNSASSTGAPLVLTDLNLNATDADQMTSLHHAFKDDDRAKICDLIEKKASLMAKSRFGTTPLDHGKGKTLLWLLENKKIDPNLLLRDEKPLWFKLAEEIRFREASAQNILKFLCENLNEFKHLNYKDAQEHTIISHLLPYPDLLIKFMIQGAPFSQNSRERQKIHQLCEQREDAKNIPFLLAVIKQQAVVPGSALFFSLLEGENQNHELAKALEKSYCLTEDEMNSLREFHRHLSLFKTPSIPLSTLLHLKTKLEEILSSLDEKKFSYIPQMKDHVEELFSDLLEREERANAWILSHENVVVSDVLSYRPAPDEDPYLKLEERRFNNVEDILSLCFQNKKYSLIPLALLKLKSFSDLFWIQKSLFQFIGDKTEIADPENGSHFTRQFGSGGVQFQAIVLRNALTQVLITIDNDPLLSTEEISKVKSLYLKLIPALECAAYLDFLIKDCSDPNIPVQAILQLITDKNRDFPLFIPLGCLRHAVCLCVAEEELTVYNTGQGLDHHPHLRHKSQTALKFTDVSQETLLSEQYWKDLLAAKTQPTMDPFYETIKKMGKESPPSLDPSDYEASQSNNSCSAQCLMACYKDRCSQALPKKVHKHLKEITLLPLAEERLGLADPDLQPLISQKMIKKKAFLSLETAAKDPIQSQELRETLMKKLQEYGETDLIACADSMSKQAWFYSCHQKLAEKWLQDIKLFNLLKEEEKKHLSLAILIFQDKKERREAVSSYLQILLEKKEWKKAGAYFAFSYCTRGSFFDATGWLVDAESKLPPEDYTRLIQVVYTEFYLNPKKLYFYLLLQEDLKQLNREDLAKRLESVS